MDYSRRVWRLVRMSYMLPNATSQWSCLFVLNFIDSPSFRKYMVSLVDESCHALPPPKWTDTDLFQPPFLCYLFFLFPYIPSNYLFLKNETASLALNLYRHRTSCAALDLRYLLLPTEHSNTNLKELIWYQVKWGFFSTIKIRRITKDLWSFSQRSFGQDPFQNGVIFPL